MKRDMTQRVKRQYVRPAPPVTGHRRAVFGRVAPLLLPLLLINAAAIWGQAGWAYERITDPGWLPLARLVLAILFATAIESIGIFLAWEAHLAMMADQASGPLRAGSYGIGAVAGWINWDHWHRGGADDTRAATFAGLSAISPWLWSIWSRARNRTRLAELNQADSRGLKLSTSRKFWHPIRSIKLTRWAAWSGETIPSAAVRAWEATLKPSATPATTTAPPKAPRPPVADTSDRASTRVPAPAPVPTSQPKSSPKKVRVQAENEAESIIVRGRAAQQKRATEAAALYQSSVATGTPLTPAQLAKMFPPMSSSWARKVINNAPANGHAPVERIAR